MAVSYPRRPGKVEDLRKGLVASAASTAATPTAVASPTAGPSAAAVASATTGTAATAVASATAAAIFLRPSLVHSDGSSIELSLVLIADCGFEHVVCDVHEAKAATFDDASVSRTIV